MSDYTKLSNLINDTFTVEKVEEYVFKKWDNEDKRMLISKIYEEGYRQIYPVESDKGKLDLGKGQLSSLLEAAQYGGKSDIIGKTFKVKSNGKSGMDIRYYFSTVIAKPEKDGLTELSTQSGNEIEERPY